MGWNSPICTSLSDLGGVFILCGDIVGGVSDTETQPSGSQGGVTRQKLFLRKRTGLLMGEILSGVFVRAGRRNARKEALHLRRNSRQLGMFLLSAQPRQLARIADHLPCRICELEDIAS